MRPDAIAGDATGTQAGAASSKLSDVLTLAKVRVNALVVLTTAAGYYIATPATSVVSGVVVAVVCFGTALVAAGAAAANQVYERATDELMLRTRRRPVAAGRMSPVEGRVIAATLTLVGMGILWVSSNPAAVVVAGATFVSYAFIYTPLKRRTSLSTVVGAVPGALPPLIGWAAARGSVDGMPPWTLFVILFLWQLPHFLAIAWIYREDYARAGMPMLPVIDRQGVVTGLQAMLWAAALIPFSLLPVLFGLTDAVYAVGALALGIGQLVFAVAFARQRSLANARGLFYASIVYLPLLLALMVFGRR